jgi:predicted neuraminidase
MSDQDRKSLVYKGVAPNCTCCDQALRILPNGEWVVVFMTGGNIEPEPANFVALCRSTNQGETWGPMETVLRRDDRACTLTEALVHGNELIVFVNIHAGYFDRWLNYTIRSRDHGRTWSEPEPFAPLPRRGFVRNIYRASWGDWIMPFQYYEPTGNPDASPLKDGSLEHAQIGTLVSRDEGRTWARSNLVPGRYWAEANVVELRDGRLVMLNRADLTGCLWRGESTDRGSTWSDPVRTDIPNPGSKFRLFRLRDGRIALIHNPNAQTRHPNSKTYALCNRNPLALWISDDDMQSWGYQRILTDFPGHLAYPDGEVDGNEAYIHFAFDYNRHDIVYWGAGLPGNT